jgi:hypothetical protein
MIVDSFIIVFIRILFNGSMPASTMPFFPMMYYRDGLFYPYLDQWIEKLKRTYSGLGIGRLSNSRSGLVSSDIIDQIEYGRSKAVSGKRFFQSGTCVELQSQHPSSVV